MNYTTEEILNKAAENISISIETLKTLPGYKKYYEL